VQSGELTTSRGREVLAHMVEHETTAAEAMKALGIEKVDDSELRDLCRQLLDENPQVVAEVKAGKQKAVGALIGKAKQRNPNVNPGQVREICLELIAGT